MEFSGNFFCLLCHADYYNYHCGLFNSDVSPFFCFVWWTVILVLICVISSTLSKKMRMMGEWWFTFFYLVLFTSHISFSLTFMPLYLWHKKKIQCYKQQATAWYFTKGYRCLGACMFSFLNFLFLSYLTNYFIRLVLRYSSGVLSLFLG